jgi:hypothetical protein
MSMKCTLSTSTLALYVDEMHILKVHQQWLYMSMKCTLSTSALALYVDEMSFIFLHSSLEWQL